MDSEKKTLWELLWDYDPNGLVAVNSDMIIQVVNPAFCQMFKVEANEVIGKELSSVLHGDTEQFRECWRINRVIRGQERAYLDNTLYVRKIIFPIRAQNIIACILVDLTPEWQKRNEFRQFRQ